MLDAREGSAIYAGLKSGIDEPRLRRAIQEGNVAECLHRFTPRAGDFLFLRAGTVHAVGGGVLLAEIQQTSDATFRLFDWNRRDAQGQPRPLHIEEAIACTDFRQTAVNPTHVPEFTKSEAPDVRLPLLREPFLNVDYVHANQTIDVGGDGRLQTLLVLGGHARWPDGGDVSLGQVWVLPAAMARQTLRVEEPLRGILAALP